ncbi:MAG: radical SAM family heme chaperone HemW [Phycisphaerales bacterium]|nr:radical SAM family heme chaperone HemW [Phycisphaerales bacterium]
MDVGLYIHIPFCRRKCGYCDFVSQHIEPDLAEAFVHALLRELHTTFDPSTMRIVTVFIGGGTPTILPMDLLHRLLAGLVEWVRPDTHVEFTMEANPETVQETTIELLRVSGVNRLSLGVQSFHQTELEVLNRGHHPEDVIRSVSLARGAGMPHCNLDLIFGIPGQSLSTWQDNLRQAMGLNPDHLSCYGLTYEPGTNLHRQRESGAVRPVAEEVEAEMYLAAIDQLTEAGFARYEISNFARPEAQCLHNLRYWHQEPVIGLGPSAAGYLQGHRWKNVTDLREYIRMLNRNERPVMDVECLPPFRRAGELAMLMLRTAKGINRREFEEKTGFDPLCLFADITKQHQQVGLLDVSPDGICLTREGLLLADTVLADFMLIED